MRWIWRDFGKGLIAFLPVIVTVALVLWLGHFIEQVLGEALRMVMPEQYYLPGTGIVLGIVLILALGSLMHAWAFEKLFGWVEEKLIYRMPSRALGPWRTS